MPSLEAVRTFWEHNPCDAHQQSFEDKIAFRYRKDWFIPELISLIGPTDKVLEIGCGQGVDLYHIAQRTTKQVTGVDLTKAGIANAKALLEQRGVKADLRVMNAEKLTFPQNTFDIVYSYGVLHHTVNTEQAVKEAIRVLKPGGKLIIMMYNRDSLQYIGLQFARAITAPIKPLIAHALNKRQLSSGTLLQELFLCPIVKAYTDKDYKRMFKGLRIHWIRNYQTGCIKLMNVLPFLSLWLWLEKHTQRQLGLLKVIYAEKGAQ